MALSGARSLVQDLYIEILPSSTVAKEDGRGGKKHAYSELTLAYELITTEIVLVL